MPVKQQYLQYVIQIQPDRSGFAALYVYKNIIHFDGNPLLAGAGSRCRPGDIIVNSACYGFNVASFNIGTSVANALQTRTKHHKRSVKGG
jgi:hypothetical protein